MEPNQVIVNITSSDPERLTKFYEEIVQLPKYEGMGETAFRMAEGAVLVFDNHSEISGPTKEPARVLINFMVDDLVSEEKRLEMAGVKTVRSQGKEFWGGVISTFLDPDGNYFQLIEYKGE